MEEREVEGLGLEKEIVKDLKEINLETLPVDDLERILLLLEPEDLKAVCMSSEVVRELCRNEEFRRAYDRERHVSLRVRYKYNIGEGLRIAGELESKPLFLYFVKREKPRPSIQEDQPLSFKRPSLIYQVIVGSASRVTEEENKKGRNRNGVINYLSKDGPVGNKGDDTFLYNVIEFILSTPLIDDDRSIRVKYIYNSMLKGQLLVINGI